MTSRQRALAALNHQEGDRVPIDIGGLVLFSCWHEEEHDKMKAYLGYEGGEKILNSFSTRTVRPDPRVRERFHSDFFGLVGKANSQWTLEVTTDDEGGQYYTDEFGMLWKNPFEGHYFDVVKHPLAGATFEDVARFKWPDPTDPARIAGVKELAKEMYETTDKCICYSPILATGIFAVSGMLQGWEDHFVNLRADKRVANAVMEGLTEFHLAHIDMVLKEMGDYVQVLCMSDDLGFQDTPMIRAEMFREMVKPHYKRVVDFIKSKRPDMKIVFHTDGVVWPFYYEFIDLGIDATNPIQVNCKGMDDTKWLKKEFGDKLTFWGAGVDTQWTMPYGTPDDVRNEVINRIGDLAHGGGYVFAVVHNVQYDVPEPNVVMAYDTAYEWSWYPLKPVPEWAVMPTPSWG